MPGGPSFDRFQTRATDGVAMASPVPVEREPIVVEQTDLIQLSGQFEEVVPALPDANPVIAIDVLAHTWASSNSQQRKVTTFHGECSAGVLKFTVCTQFEADPSMGWANATGRGYCVPFRKKGDRWTPNLPFEWELQINNDDPENANSPYEARLVLYWDRNDRPNLVIRSGAPQDYHVGLKRQQKVR